MMSKSLGNGVDTLELIDKYGADALRFFLATGNSPGNDMRFSEARVESCRNFANKLYNASRFVHMNIDDYDVPCTLPEELTTEDKWIISSVNRVAKEVSDNLDKFELGMAVQKLYDFIWDCYCDWYIELTKSRLREEGETAQNARRVLTWVLERTLRLLHPFMPFITEEIWQTLPHAAEAGETIMLEKYPEYCDSLNFPEAVKATETIMEAITAIRTRRNEMNVPPSKKAKVFIATKNAETYKQGEKFIISLASANEVEIAEEFDLEGAVTIIVSDAKIYIPMNELVDKEAEIARLQKEYAQVEKLLKQDEGKLANEGFMAKAPAAVVEKIKGQAEREREKLSLIQAAIDALK